MRLIATIRLSIALFAASLLTAPASDAGESFGTTPQPCVNFSNYPQLLGVLPLEDLTAVALRLPWAYVASYLDGLFVVDVSRPERPEIVAHVESLSPLLDIELSPGFAYVATNDNGLEVLDTSDPSQPLQLWHYPVHEPTVTGEAYIDLAIQDQYLYALSSRALRIFKLGSMGSIEHVGTFTLANNGHQVTVQGERAYVGVWGGDLYIVDVSEPSEPVLISMLDTPGAARDVEVLGNVALVVDRDAGLLSYDIEDPHAPQLLGSVPSEDVALRIAVGGSLAFFSDGYAGLKVVDVTNPEQPQLVGKLGASQLFKGNMVVEGTTAYVPTYKNGFQIIDVHRTGLQPEVAWLPGEFGRAMTVDDDQVVVAGWPDLKIFDVDGSGTLAEVGSLQTPTVCGIERQGDLAFLAMNYDGFSIVDLSVPETPVLLSQTVIRGHLGHRSAVNDVAVRGQYVFLATAYAGDGLWVFDVSNPAEPEAVTRLDTGLANAISLWRDWAFLAYHTTPGFMEAIDISDPTSPRSVSLLSLPIRPWDLDVVDGIAYVVPWSGLKRMYVIDVSVPGQPEVLSHSDLVDDARSVRVRGNRAFVGATDAGVHVVDVSDPRSPVWEGILEYPFSLGGIWAVDVSEDRLYALRSRGGLNIGPFPCRGRWTPIGDILPRAREVSGESNVLVKTYPNPSNPAVTVEFETPRPGRVSGRVFDAAGRRIATLVDGYFVSGKHEIRWNGQDRHGREVASGVYLVEIWTESQTQRSKVTLLR